MPNDDTIKTTSQAGHVCSTAELGGPKERCHADRDGDCVHANCPQLRDGEPKSTGRHCPLDVDDDDDLWLDDDGDWCDRCNGDGEKHYQGAI